MALQERIIGGGFLVIGVAVVLILIFIFGGAARDPKDAYDEVTGKLFPEYLAAEGDKDYVGMKNAATRIVDMMEEGGAKVVRKYIQEASISGRPEDRRLHELAKSRTFTKNKEGLFGFEDEWHDAETHGALVKLQEAVDGLKVLSGVRRTAQQAWEALKEARTGSKLPLEPPPAPKVADDPIPIIEPNPVYAADAELYRVFGIEPGELSAALAVKDPGGRSTSARIRWNKNVTTSRLAEEIDALPQARQTLEQLAISLGVAAPRLARTGKSRGALGRLLDKGAGIVGAGLEGEQRETFQSNRKKFADGDALSRVLRQEAELLKPYVDRAKDLAKVFKQPFVQ